MLRPLEGVGVLGENVNKLHFFRALGAYAFHHADKYLMLVCAKNLKICTNIPIFTAYKIENYIRSYPLPFPFPFPFLFQF